MLHVVLSRCFFTTETAESVAQNGACLAFVVCLSSALRDITFYAINTFGYHDNVDNVNNNNTLSCFLSIQPYNQLKHTVASKSNPACPLGHNNNNDTLSCILSLQLYNQLKDTVTSKSNPACSLSLLTQFSQIHKFSLKYKMSYDSVESSDNSQQNLRQKYDSVLLRKGGISIVFGAAS